MRTRVVTLLIVSIVAVVMAGVLPGIHTAYAWTTFYRWISVGAVTCTDTGFSTANQTVHWHYAPVGTFSMETVLNGSSLGGGAPSAMPPGSNAFQTFSGLNVTTGTSTFVYEVIYRSYWDTTLVYLSTLTISCNGPGLGTASVANVSTYTEGSSPAPAAAGATLPVVPAGASGAGASSADASTLPVWAVVGTFIASTPLYYAPYDYAATTYLMEAGKSLWVTGISVDLDFYQVVLGGRTLWVPVDSMGTTYDAVWNGAALPETVVD